MHGADAAGSAASSATPRAPAAGFQSRTICQSCPKPVLIAGMHLKLAVVYFFPAGERKGREGGGMEGTPAPNCTHCDVFEDLSDIHKVSKRPERHERESSPQPLTSARTCIAWAAAMQDIHGTQPAGAVQGCRQGVACCQVARVTAAPRTRNLPAHRLQILNAHGGRCRFAASGRSTSSRARWVTPP